MDQERADYADPRPPRWGPTERQEEWFALAVCLIGPLVLLAAIILSFYFGRRWLD